MRYTQPTILNSCKATLHVKSIASNKADPRVPDNPNDLNSLGTSSAYEADE